MEGKESPKYLQLKQEMMSWLLSGKCKDGERIPSENEMASQFGISRHTVRQAIGDMVNEGWLYRVQGKGTFVRSQEAPKEDGSKTVALITTYISDYIFPDIIRGAEAALRERGYRLLLSCTDNDKGMEKQALESLLSHPVSGLMIEPTKSTQENVNLDYFLSLEYRRIPFVMIHERYREMNAPCIRVDDLLGGRMATEHLLSLGHRRIAGLFKSDDLQGVDRMKGFMEAHRQAKLAVDPRYVRRFTTENRLERTTADVLELLAYPAEERPTALICYNDELAVRIIRLVKEQGIKVPEEMSVLGFDDATVAVAGDVPITTLSHPKEELGRRAALELIQRIEGRGTDHDNKDIIYPPELILRESTAVPNRPITNS